MFKYPHIIHMNISCNAGKAAAFLIPQGFIDRLQKNYEALDASSSHEVGVPT